MNNKAPMVTSSLQAELTFSVSVTVTCHNYTNTSNPVCVSSLKVQKYLFCGQIIQHLTALKLKLILQKEEDNL